jgi:hypothetical protein
MTAHNFVGAVTEGMVGLRHSLPLLADSVPEAMRRHLRQQRPANAEARTCAKSAAGEKPALRWR